MNKQKKIFLYNWALQICDPFKMISGIVSLPRYFSQYVRYKRMAAKESVRVIDLHPQLHDRKKLHELDAHYFFVNAWAMRRVVFNNPSWHMDVASQTVFAGLLSAVLPVTYMDYRPFKVTLSNLECVEGNILNMPFNNDSISSISCLHVAEHIGLGRYGDPLDPDGTRKAALELKRVLSRGGNLFFAVPVGRPRVCFNAHRIHVAKTICEYFSGLRLMEFSGVHDNGLFVEKTDLAEFDKSDYALGMFWFKKSGSK
jgi:SAM-dependent methyltransferase